MRVSRPFEDNVKTPEKNENGRYPSRTAGTDTNPIKETENLEIPREKPKFKILNQDSQRDELVEFLNEGDQPDKNPNGPIRHKTGGRDVSPLDDFVDQQLDKE